MSVGRRHGALWDHDVADGVSNAQEAEDRHAHQLHVGLCVVDDVEGLDRPPR
jgi:hypothetical protein